VVPSNDLLFPALLTGGVGHSEALLVLRCSCGNWRLMAPAASMTRARAAAAEWKPVGAPDDEADLGVEAFDAAVGDAVFDGVEDEVAALAQGAGALDERFEPGALGSDAPAVQHYGGLVAGEVAGEDGPELFCHLVGPPDTTAVAADLVELGGLAVGEVFGVLQQRPAGTLEVFGPSGRPQLVPELAAHVVESVVDELDQVERIGAYDGPTGRALRPVPT
jgi:hypothetical protein